MAFNISSENMKFYRKSVQYTEELDHYYCIIRVYDKELAKENYNGDGKSLVLINHPIIFKTEEDACRYLFSKVPIHKLPLYVTPMLGKYKKNYSNFIIGEYKPIDE